MMTITTYAPRDLALAHYAELKQGKTEAAGAYLIETASTLSPSRYTLHDCAYYLWVAGEYAHATGDTSELQPYASFIEKSVALIGAHWQKPAVHWLWGERSGIYFSGMALYYAAMRSAAHILRLEEAHRIGKDIRSVLFTDFMNGTHLVSERGTDAIWADIVLAAVPFGYVTPGDLALLKSLDRLDVKGLQGDHAAILSWYYSECGQTASAKRLLEQAVQGREGKPSIWVEMAQQAAAALPVRAEVEFEHEPLGSESPYIVRENERSPRMVTAGDTVVVRTLARSLEPLEEVWLSYRVNGGEERRVRMIAIEEEDSELHWRAEISDCDAFASVEYRFIAHSGGKPFHSGSYRYEVLRWSGIEEVAGYRAETGRVDVYYASPTGIAGNPSYKLGLHIVEGGMSMTFGTAEGKEGDEASGPLHSFEEGDSVSIGSLQLHYREGGLSWQIVRGASDLLPHSYGGSTPALEVLTDSKGKVHKLRMNTGLTEEERLYGMGERFAGIQFRGFELDHYVFNQYKDQGFRTYIPIPFVMSSEGYGLFLDSSLYSSFRCGTRTSDMMQVEADVHRDRQTLRWYVWTGEPLELLNRFTALTGRPKLPPKWAFGPWMSSNNWDSEQETDWQLEQTARHAIPSTVLVLEQWSDEASFYIFNDAQYQEKSGEARFVYDDFTFPAWGRWPNPKALVERIHEQNIRLLLWQAPVMKYMEGIPHAQRDADERTMVERGYAVRRGDGTPYRIPHYEWFRGSLVPDFTSEEAAEWWLSKRQYLLDDIGIDGFKTDGGECIYGSDATFHDGRDGAEMRNEYPNAYIGAFHRFADRFVEGGAITFSRSGYTGAQNTPLHWAGDEKSTFDAYRSSIVAGLSSGLSGLPFWGWDLGGFSGDIPTAELYIRSTQMAAFCPVMQYHAESKGQFNQDRTPWNIAERTGCGGALMLYKRYADLRMNMLPYIYEQAAVSSATGAPLMRAMLLDYPHDPVCAELAQQYMFGANLLVAPVTEEGATEARVYLPRGQWLPLLEAGAGPLAGGLWLTADADLARIPVYMKGDSVLPLNLDASYRLASHVGNATDKHDQLCFMIFVSAEVNYAFRDETGADVKLRASASVSGLTAEVESAGEEPVTLICRGLQRSCSVRVDGVQSPLAVTEAELACGHTLLREGEVLIKLGAGVSRIEILHA